MAAVKRSSKSAKLVLDQSFLEEEFYENAILLGIVCPLNSHRFAWQLDTFLGLKLIRNHDFTIEVGDIAFPVFYLHELDKMMEHIVYANRRAGAYLLPELKNIDYIWLLKGNNNLQGYQKEIVQRLQLMPSIESCFFIPLSPLKSKHLLIV